MNESLQQAFGTSNVVLIVTLFWVLIVWSVIWKGLALWKAAKKGDKIWFVVFMILNTAGVLEILYIYVFGKKTSKNSE